MVRKTIDSDLKKKIIRYLKDHSQYAAAKKFKVSPSTVNKIANDPQVKETIRVSSEPKRATEVHVAYAKADRLRVLNKLMGRVDMESGNPELRTGNIKDLTIAAGVLCDKFRLEEKDEDELSKGEVIDQLNRMKEGDVRTT